VCSSDLERTLTRRAALLGGAPLDTPRQVQLPWEEIDDGDDDSDDERLGRPGLLDDVDERHQLDSLIELARLASAHSSKLACLSRFLHRCREPVVVFTEYRDTLRAACAALSPAFRVASIHGGIPAGLRQEVIGQFDGGDVEVLLATDTAGEGLNLHRRCRLVIDLELPWNPLRIEQRVGRVDRLGQQRAVHALHLFHRGTVEDRVLANLERRRTVASTSLGDEAEATEQAIAQAVFDGVGPSHSRVASVVSARVDGANEERQRIDHLRLIGRRPSGSGGRPVFAATRLRRGSAIAVYEHVHMGATGGIVEREVAAHRLDLRHVHGVPFWRRLAGAI
jgi:superfamily II DNA or RNA helicase